MSKKRRTKKTRALRAPAAKKRSRKSKRAAKNVRKIAAKTVKKAKKTKGKATKKAPGKPGKKPGKKSVRKTAAKERNASARAIAPAAEAKSVAPKKSAPNKFTSSAAASPKPNAAERRTYFITTAIAYPNGIPHIGHAYEAIATDALARFQRLDGKDVFFLTGTDEHGLKMIQTAQSEGMTPAELAARNAGRFKEMDQRLNVSFDRFIRTSEPAHHRSVQVIWNRMQQNGDIYIDTYAGWYSVRDEAYYAEDETVVGEDNVRRGPQGTPVEWVEEKSYFFKLSAYQDKLLALYEDQPDFIGPDSRRNEVMSFV